jgi:hypothetical protein
MQIIVSSLIDCLVACVMYEGGGGGLQVDWDVCAVCMCVRDDA